MKGKFTIDFDNKTIELSNETTINELVQLTKNLPQVADFKVIPKVEVKKEIIIEKETSPNTGWPWSTKPYEPYTPNETYPDPFKPYIRYGYDTIDYNSNSYAN